jgi:hypothetical protein
MMLTWSSTSPSGSSTPVSPPPSTSVLPSTGPADRRLRPEGRWSSSSARRLRLPRHKRPRAMDGRYLSQPPQRRALLPRGNRSIHGRGPSNAPDPFLESADVGARPAATCARASSTIEARACCSSRSGSGIGTMMPFRSQRVPAKCTARFRQVR